MRKFALVLPLVGGCWLGNDFSRFEHADGGKAHDLAIDQSIPGDGSASTDAAFGDGGATDLPSSDMGDPCLGELAWTVVTPAGFTVPARASLMTLPTANGNILFLIGGCTGATCVSSDVLYQLTVNSTGQITPANSITNANIVAVHAAAAPIPDASLNHSDTPLFAAFGGTTDPEEFYVVYTGPQVSDSSRTPFISPNPPTAVAAAVFGEPTWFVGGDVAGEPTAAVYSLSDSSSLSWTLAPASLTHPRSHAALAVLGAGNSAELWAIGGLGAGGTILSSVEGAADPASAWTDVAALTTARFDHAAATAPDGRIYVVGGDTGATSLASVEVTCGRSFVPMKSALPAAITIVSAAVGADNRLYALGTTKTSSNTAAIYAYGPTATVGDAVHVTGSGFYPNASVVVFDSSHSIVGSGSADAAGTLGSGIPLANPAPIGQKFTVMDAVSQYPTIATVP